MQTGTETGAFLQLPCFRINYCATGLPDLFLLRVVNCGIKRRILDLSDILLTFLKKNFSKIPFVSFDLFLLN